MVGLLGERALSHLLLSVSHLLLRVRCGRRDGLRNLRRWLLLLRGLRFEDPERCSGVHVDDAPVVELDLGAVGGMSLDVGDATGGAGGDVALSFGELDPIAGKEYQAVRERQS